MRFIRKIISVFCIFLIVLSAVAVVPAAAADTAVISANDITTYKGYTVSVNIRAENLSNVGSLDVEIYYDSEAITLKEVKNGSFVSGCLVSSNRDVVGVVSSSIASLTGLSGSGTLLTLSFTVKSDCAAGTYPIVVAVGDAYSVDLQAVNIESRSSSLVVKENTVQVQTFSLSVLATPTTVASGSVTTVSVRNSNSRSFMSGDFIFEYDRDLFVLESVELASALKTENAVYSVNTSTAGYIKISYISTVATSSYNLYTVKLRAKNTEETSSTLSISCADVYKDNQTVYNSYSTTAKLSLTMEPPAPDYPEVYTVTDGVAFEGGSLSSVLCIEEDSNLAAADFVVSYNTDVLECESVSVSDEVTADNGIVVLNQNFKEGKIKFSYVNQKGTTKALTLINITWRVKENTTRHYVLSTNATGVVDAKFNPVTLTFKTEEGCVYKNVKTDEPDCVNPGAEYYNCSQKEASYILLPNTTYPESDHPYANSISKEYSFAYDGAAALTIKFNSQTNFENSCDKLYVYDKNKKLVGTYTGTQLSGAEITVASDAFTLRLTTDGSVQKYGFKIDSIYAQNVPCNKSETIVKELPASGHNMEYYRVEPTCTEEGYECDKCTRCGVENGNKVIPVTAHNYVVVNEIPATCTSAGKIEYACQCGASYSEETKVKEHVLEYYSVASASCIDIGYECYKCINCSVEFGRTELEPLDHTGGEWEVVVAATCTENGYRIKKCTVCEAEADREVLEATGHSYEEETVVSPTCITEGISRHTCTVCGYSYDESIPVSDEHSVFTVRKEPTCAKVGTEQYICKDCGNMIGAPIILPKTEHQFDDGKIISIPTETENGSEEHSCISCGKTEIATLPSLSFRTADGVTAEYSSGIIYGLDVGAASVENYILPENDIYNWFYETSEGRLVTDTKVILKYGDFIIKEYRILIFGDVNGDGWYDGMDAVLVSCIANGMLTKDDVSEAVYMAADCNHDGVIDQLDVDLLNEAGTLLANVDQSKPADVLLETSSEYVEYISLIDQTYGLETETDTSDAKEEIVSITYEQTNTATGLFELIMSLINSIFGMFIDFLPALYK